MALRDIVQDTQPSLRKISRSVTTFDEKLGKLLDDMKETMEVADGVGLAGPQVGINRRLAVVEVEEFYLELINPVIVEASGEQIGAEGCLSVKNRYCNVKRPSKITVQFQDRFGNHKSITVQDFIARACCHEIDHLDGILFYDKEYKD